MEPNELIKRYIYAATRRLPGKIKDDVALELRSIISDMLEERCAGLTPSEKDVRVVLTELGTPRELEEKYQPNGSRTLLSGLYYSVWQTVVKIVLLCVGFGVSVASIIDFLESRSAWYLALGGWFAGLFTGGLAAFGAVTILFAVFQRKGVCMSDAVEGLDQLPPVPSKRLEIPLHEPIFGIALQALFIFAFLVFPQRIIVGIFEGGLIIPVFTQSVLQSCWPFIAGIAIIGLLHESFALLERRYTKRLILTGAVSNVLTMLLAGLWLATDSLLNPRLLSQMRKLFSADEPILWMTERIPQLLFAVIVFACVMDLATTLWKLKEIEA